MRRRILLVSHRADLTGSPLCLVDLVRGMDRRRFEPVVLLGEDGPIRPLLIAEGVAPEVLDRKEGRGMRGWWTLRRRLKQLAPDLVQLTGAVGFSKSAALAARTLGQPVVWHLHDDFRLPKFRRRRGWVRRLSHCLVACAESVAREIPSRKTRVIVNGVMHRDPVDEAARTEARHALGLPEDAFVLASIGSVKALKNSHLIVEAAGRLRERHPQVRFVLMGESDQPDYRERLATAIRNSLAGTVQLRDPSPDVQPLLLAADAVLLPSAVECFPRILLEAAALGRPTVASAVGDVPTMVRDGEDAWLMPSPVDLDALVATLDRVLQAGPAEAVRRGVNAREQVRRQYPLTRYVQAFEQLWDELLS